MYDLSYTLLIKNIFILFIYLYLYHASKLARINATEGKGEEKGAFIAFRPTAHYWKFIA